MTHLARLHRFWKLASKITVEPVLFMYKFAHNMISVTIVTMLMERSCLIEHGHPEHMCKQMFKDASYHDIKIEAQKSANNWLVFSLLIVTFPSIFCAVLCGPWSDKYGRKPIIIGPLIGNVFYGLGLILMACYASWPSHVVLLVAIPNALFGGYIHMMPLMSYISDVSTNEQRSTKFLFVEGIYLFAYPLGSLAGGYIYKVTGYVCVFSCSTAIYILSILYTAFLVKETKGTEFPLSKKHLIRELFRLQQAKVCISVFTKPRSSYGRRNLFLLAASLTVVVTYYEIQSNVLYMYSQLFFDWGEVKFSVFQSTTLFASICFNAFVAPVLVSVFGLNDVAMAVFGSISAIFSMMIMTLAKNTWQFYLGGLTGLFFRMVSPICRSLMTQIVGPGDTGKMFAIVSSVESFFPVVGNLMISRTYNATVDVFPGAALFFVAFLLLLPLCTYLTVLSTKKESNSEEDKLQCADFHVLD
ncbi:Uncharacterised protein r2_g1373 [Pycnogonum litorale]